MLHQQKEVALVVDLFFICRVVVVAEIGVVETLYAVYDAVQLDAAVEYGKVMGESDGRCFFYRFFMLCKN